MTRRIASLPFSALLLAGCLGVSQSVGTPPAAYPPQSQAPKAATSYPVATVITSGESGAPYASAQTLADALKEKGVDANVGEEMEQPFVPVKGTGLTVGPELVQVYAFPDEGAAAAFAGTVSPDGTTVGTNQVDWISPPVFYRSGSLIVIYSGTDTAITSALSGLLGPPFAGG